MPGAPCAQLRQPPRPCREGHVVLVTCPLSKAVVPRRSPAFPAPRGPPSLRICPTRGAISEDGPSEAVTVPRPAHDRDRPTWPPCCRPAVGLARASPRKQRPESPSCRHAPGVQRGARPSRGRPPSAPWAFSSSRSATALRSGVRVHTQRGRFMRFSIRPHHVSRGPGARANCASDASSRRSAVRLVASSLPPPMTPAISEGRKELWVTAQGGACVFCRQRCPRLCSQYTLSRSPMAGSLG